MRALALALLALSAHAAPRPRFDRFCTRTEQGRSSRGLPCESGGTFFEAFPATGGLGTFGVCSTTAPTGTKGEALTFSRASTATCTRTMTGGGLTTTGIANGDLVTLSAGQPRVMFDAASTLGLHAEGAGQNVSLQSEDFANAIYASVGAPTVTANTTTAPDNTLTMDTIQDNSAAALEGRQQTITVTALSAYTLSVYVKAGTLSSVTISLDGTTQTCTGLSATTATRCIVTDVSASSAAIVAQVLGGTAIGDTGTFIAWGQDVELGIFATSYIPTLGSAVARSLETADFAGLSFAPSVGFSLAASQNVIASSVWVAGGGALSPILTTGAAGAAIGAVYWWPYVGASFVNIATDSAGVSTVGVAGFNPNLGAIGTQMRFASAHTGAAHVACQDGTCITSGSSTYGAPSFTRLKVFPATGGAASQTSSIISRLCLDSNPFRCR